MMWSTARALSSSATCVQTVGRGASRDKNHSMKVLHVAYNAAPQFGGAYRSIVLFRLAAATRDYLTQCITFDDCPQSNPHLGDEENWCVVPTRQGMLGRQYGSIARSTQTKLKNVVESADIVFVHLLYRYHAIWAAHCAREFGKPVVIVPHGGLDPYVFTYRTLRKRLWLKAYHRLLFRDNLVLYATDRERDKAAAAVGKVAARCLFWPMDDETCQLADTLPRIALTPRRLLLVGRLHPMKCVLETVRAFRRANVAGWQLDVIGAETGDISVDAVRTAAGEDWGRSVVYRGVLDRRSLYTEYSKASALILASHRENFGHVVAEAMRFGLPVLISEDVDLHTVVRRSGAGVVIPIGSENGIFDALCTFLRMPAAQLQTLGDAARRAAQEHFDFQNFASKYCGILEGLTRPVPKRAGLAETYSSV